jgi:hypothetical protein
VLTASIICATIALMMKAASTSETTVTFYQTTRHNKPEDSHLHTRRSQNLKCYLLGIIHKKKKIKLHEY